MKLNKAQKLKKILDSYKTDPIAEAINDGNEKVLNKTMKEVIKKVKAMKLKPINTKDLINKD